MRTGPWILGAGVLLLAAGVASTRTDAWDTRIPASTLVLQLDGIDTIDMRDSRIDKVRIAGGGRAHLHYPGGQAYRWRNDEPPAPPPACSTNGTTLRCVSGERYLPDAPTLQLPPGDYRLLLRGASVHADAGVGSVALEVEGRVSWTGPAATLEVAMARPEAGKTGGHCEFPQFVFEDGRVGSLRIRAEAGEVSFGKLAGVGRIELQAARDVGLRIDRAEDIARIGLLPLAGGPGDGGAAGADHQARAGCVAASHAAAMAARQH